MKNVTTNSIVLIDEICRSTRPEDGQFLAWNICEKMICLRGIAHTGKYYSNDEIDSNEVDAVDEDHQSEQTRSSYSTMPRIIDITAPFVFITTHYFNLTKLPEYYFNAIK